MIIAMCGRAGSGKDTSARIIQELLEENHLVGKTLAFAGPLKRVCQEIVGSAFSIPPEHFVGSQDEKNSSLEDYGLPDWSGRKILQFIGTEGFRTIHPEVWPRLCIANAKQLLHAGAHGVIITDCRFLSEEQMVHDAGGVVIRTHRSKVEDDFQGIQGHQSELEIAKLKTDFELDNNGTLEELRDQLIDVLDQLDWLQPW